MNIISRKEAVVQGLKRYFTGKPCTRGHIDEKYVSGDGCVVCSREKAAKSRKENPEKHQAIRKAEYERNKDHILAHQKEYRIANWDKIYAKRKADPNYKEYMNNYLSSYFKRANPRAKHLARTRLRQLTKKHQTPAWAQTVEALKQMEHMYWLARQLTDTTGINHEVDHIIPLTHPLVCGLHCPDNLQVLTEHDNCVKSNTFSID